MREPMLIFHFIGLAMGLGTSFGMMFLARAASKMSKEDGQKFMLNALAMSRMGQIGLVILLLTGGYLMTANGKNLWSTLMDNHMLLTKLVLFLVLGAALGIIGSKAKKAKNGDMAQLDKIRPFGMLALISGLAIVVLAVLVFK
jgi:uncharacterized membrane protein